MNTTLPPDRPDQATLSAWLDGELDATTRAQVDAWLRDHPEEAAQVRLWAADRDALRARFDPVLDEPIPPALLQAVQQHRSPAAANQANWRRVAVVAGLLLTGGLAGGLVGVSVGSGESASLAALSLPWSDGSKVRSGGWQHRAAVAHTVYAPEVRHPVEVSVAQGSAAEQRAQEEHLARWLSKRLDMPVQLYDLRPQGFELVGGRLLPDTAGPSAQLMYQNGGGQRVTLYLRKPESGASSAFRFQRDGDLNLFYWVEDGYGCALVGKLPREQLAALADAIYKQAEEHIQPSVEVKRPAS